MSGNPNSPSYVIIYKSCKRSKWSDFVANPVYLLQKMPVNTLVVGENIVTELMAAAAAHSGSQFHLLKQRRCYGENNNTNLGVQAYQYRQAVLLVHVHQYSLVLFSQWHPLAPEFQLHLLPRYFLVVQYRQCHQEDQGDLQPQHTTTHACTARQRQCRYVTQLSQTDRIVCGGQFLPKY